MQATFPAACHSIGFPALCAVQLLERMAGYMLAVSLALFLDESLRMGAGAAAHWAGIYLALSYAAAVPGGMLVDLYLGPSRAVRAAVLLSLLGYALALVGPKQALIGSGLLLVLGGGLFRPAVATITGALGELAGRDRFRWLYLAVNVAALTAPALAALLHSRYGWRAILVTSTALLALAWVLVGRHRGNVQVRVRSRPSGRREDHGQGHRAGRSLLAFLAVLVLFGIAIHQSNGTLLFWARDMTRRNLLGCTIPPETFAMLPGGLVLVYTPLLAWLTSAMARRNHPISPRSQMAGGLLLLVAAYALMIGCALLRRSDTLVSPLWLIGCLSLLTLSEALIWPLGMRLVGELVPAHRIAQAHGLFSLAIALGHWLAGEVGSLWERWPHVAFFALLATISVSALALLTVTHLGSRPEADGAAT